MKNELKILDYSISSLKEPNKKKSKNGNII
jgi:hypothetical protein